MAHRPVHLEWKATERTEIDSVADQGMLKVDVKREQEGNMRCRYSTMAAWMICLLSLPVLAADGPEADRPSDPGAREEYSIFDSRDSGPSIDPGSVSMVLEGAAEADLVDTPTEEFVTFASMLWAYFTSDTVFEFEHLEPSEAELGVVLDVARRSRVLGVELQQVRKRWMCRELRQYRDRGLTPDQSMQMAVDYYESAEVKAREYEEVASFIREEIERELGADFLADFEREAVLHGKGSTATRVSSRSFFGVSNEEFVADCEE